MKENFEEIKKLNALAEMFKPEPQDNAYVNTECLDKYVKCLYNNIDAAKDVLELFSVLVKEYNNCYDNWSASTRSKYNICLYRCFEYFLPFFSVKEKLIALINMCILSDSEAKEDYNLHSVAFEKTVTLATKYANKLSFIKNADESKVDIELLHLLGLFNFRIHDFEKAADFFCASAERRRSKIDESDICTIEAYVEDITYLAECYEYTGKVAKAIETLTDLNEEELKKCIHNRGVEITKYIYKEYPKILSKRNSNTCIKDLFYKFCIERNSDGKSKSIPDSYKVFEIHRIAKSMKSFVHVVAHCFSEYAAECMRTCKSTSDSTLNETITFYSILQQAARMLIDWLVVQDQSFVTCQATIRAENDACPEAIDILVEHYKREFDQVEIENNRLRDKAELEFYIFYFTEQELTHKSSNKKLKELFETYGERFKKFAIDNDDEDARFHYLVIYFKHLLKESLHSFLEKKESDFMTLDQTYFEMVNCRKKHSTHVFSKLLEESQRLEREYLFFREYRYLYVENPNEEKVLGFLQLRNNESNPSLFFGKKYQRKEIKEMIEDHVKQIDERRNILILAPVKEAPSCSSDFIQVKYLRTFAGNEKPNLQIDFHESINAISIIAKHNQNNNTPKYISSSQLCNIKWAYLYTAVNKDVLYIYYKEHTDENAGEMFPAKLTEFEETYLGRLLELIEKNLEVQADNNQINGCDRATHEREYSVFSQGCSTWVLSSSEAWEYEGFLNFLTFAEFDCYSLNGTRVAESDRVLFSKRKTDKGDQYCIVCFEDLPREKLKKICKSCEFKSTKDQSCEFTNTKVQPYTENTQNLQRTPCRLEYDMRKLLDNIDKWLKNNRFQNDESPSEQYKFIRKSKDIVNNCMFGNCRMNIGAECIVKQLIENGVETP